MPPKLSKFLKLIKDKLYYSDHDIVVIGYSELKDIGLDISEITQIVNLLKKKGIIIKNNDYDADPWSTIPTEYKEKEYVLKHSGFEGGKNAKSNPWLVLKIKSKENFLDFYKQKTEEKEQNIDHTETALVEIYYNPEAGIGTVDGEEFKFKDHQPEYRLFAELYKNIGNKIKREKILEIMGRKEGASATDDINNLTKKIRNRTGLSTIELVQNNSNLTLLAKKLEKPPK